MFQKVEYSTLGENIFQTSRDDTSKRNEVNTGSFVEILSAVL